jgi:hypothetical protein
MVMTLFLIGAGLSKESLKQIGAAPFLQGLLLWVVMSLASLFAIKMGFIAV